MKRLAVALCSVLLLSFQADKTPLPVNYLATIKSELVKQWPANRTINLVFHGHSVPAGYFKTPEVNTFDSYPYILLKKIKAAYPYAVINIITTAIGGEHSVNGEKRFENEVVIHKPDVLFIDYALNDKAIPLQQTLVAWQSMIEKALAKNIKVILLTPSPDQSINILDTTASLFAHATQIKQLAEKYSIGLADNYKRFRQLVAKADTISNYMSQVNHPNQKGNELIAEELFNYFK
jgi:acyl-CoA thioesterase-1